VEAMIQVRRAEDRGRTREDGLDRRHTFSFGRYYHAQQGAITLVGRDQAEVLLFDLA